MCAVDLAGRLRTIVCGYLILFPRYVSPGCSFSQRLRSRTRMASEMFSFHLGNTSSSSFVLPRTMPRIRTKSASPAGNSPVLLGGGVGVPPLYHLAKRLLAMGKQVTVILGFNTQSEVFYEAEFRALGCRVIVATADGSYGVKGFATTPLNDLNYSYFYTCGPEPMLKAVYKATRASGQMSFEERMGCGFGACMGCSCKTLTGYKRICKDGPVMRKEEILWEA